jgi:hypothetical protein
MLCICNVIFKNMLFSKCICWTSCLYIWGPKYLPVFLITTTIVKCFSFQSFWSYGASFTKLICIPDVSFQNFILWKTHNFVLLFNSFYLLMLRHHYKGRYQTKILLESLLLSCYFCVWNFAKSLDFHFMSNVNVAPKCQVVLFIQCIPKEIITEQKMYLLKNSYFIFWLRLVRFFLKVGTGLGPLLIIINNSLLQC